MKILIADDSDLMRDRIKESLKNIKGVEILEEAKDGIEAVKLIDEKKPDLVLLDIRMPQLNGIGVLKKMKENGSNAKVCILTNYPYSQYKEKCLQEGADYFFDKNQDFHTLKSLIIKLAKECV